MLVFDLDPGAPANIVQCCRVGLWVRKVFAELGLKCCAKTSGSKGLQVYVPLNTPVTYDETKPFAKTVARLFERFHPELVVSDMKKNLRVGKIFVDWSQNDDYKTTVCVYSLRAKDRPTVSTPVKWEEVEACARRGDDSALVFETHQVLARVEKFGDLFAGVLSEKQKLPAIDRLEAAAAKAMNAAPVHVDLAKSRTEELAANAAESKRRRPGSAAKRQEARAAADGERPAEPARSKRKAAPARRRGA
jgi:bifunctional non-homologous end joining protein LigD